MKATLTFDLEDIDDELAHVRCIKALDMALALSDIDDLLRDNELSVIDLVTKIREVFEDRDVWPNKLTR